MWLLDITNAWIPLNKVNWILKGHLQLTHQVVFCTTSSEIFLYERKAEQKQSNRNETTPPLPQTDYIFFPSIPHTRCVGTSHWRSLFWPQLTNEVAFHKKRTGCVKDQERIPISNKQLWKENLTLCIVPRRNQRGTEQNPV